ncbi:hypothetical protein [Billgrantia sp. C5P2]|uniref:hypothetical protein n=1 Tax=Billgrantia sp. C5P2 TaxID=3436239 RepID=UPI003DA601EA
MPAFDSANHLAIAQGGRHGLSHAAAGSPGIAEHLLFGHVHLEPRPKFLHWPVPGAHQRTTRVHTRHGLLPTGLAPALLGIALDLGAHFTLILGGMLVFLAFGWWLAQGLLQTLVSDKNG